MIDVSIRLRRAIHLNDLTLVQRIVRNNPQSLQNPDFGDKSNTSLHLAARNGFLQIAVFLIDSNHEATSISLNTDGETPLHTACLHSRVGVAKLLIERFPRCVPWKNKLGRDALMLCALTGEPSYPLMIPLLTSTPRCEVSAHDNDGNTALHHAAAAGHTKALRTLLQFGASPVAQNAYSWTPIHYSASKPLELYFRELVAEFEKKRVEGEREKERERERVQEREKVKDVERASTRRRIVGGVRLVTDVDGDAGGRGDGAPATAGATMGSRLSPVEWRRGVTPTMDEWPGVPAAATPEEKRRGRAWSGD